MRKKKNIKEAISDQEGYQGDSGEDNWPKVTQKSFQRNMISQRETEAASVLQQNSLDISFGPFDLPLQRTQGCLDKENVRGNKTSKLIEMLRK